MYLYTEYAAVTASATPVIACLNSVSVTSPDMNGLAGLICQAIARKFMQDEQFQIEILKMMEAEQGETK